ncbi:hypothetical protein BTUL_0018g00150 [Botrytis tulipae]|uniref:Helicase ATP-binding domain-containing protein n=1 Tax=Botrytis tulipae TaxID=87230 RepID=A0A4Z1F1F9_9HELO|nr:hypothetical protein BTUL_0018g00150 [Botrytis tulipae]
MNAAAIFDNVEAIKSHLHSRESLRPWGAEEVALCNIVQRQKSSVTILTGDTGTGKSTYIPAIISTQSWGCKTLLSHPNPLAIRATFRWMQSRRTDDSFAAGNMSNEVELEDGYDPKYFGIIDSKYPVHLTLISHSILSALITNDQQDGLGTLENYQVCFIDEVHIKSIELENLLLRIKGIIEKRDLQNKPIHFILSSSYMDTTILRDFFHVDDQHNLILNSDTLRPRSQISHNFAEEYSPQTRDIDLKSLLKRIVKEKAKQNCDVGILVFLPSSEVEVIHNEICHSIKAQEGDEEFEVMIMTRNSTPDQQDKILSKLGKVVFTTKDMMIGVTMSSIDTIIIGAPEYDARVYHSKVDQCVDTMIKLAQSEIEQQISALSNLSIKGSCHYLFTERCKQELRQFPPSELRNGDCLEYLLILAGIFPAKYPQRVTLDLITYPPLPIIAQQYQKLRELGLIDMRIVQYASEDVAGFCLTEKGHRTVKVPMLNGFSRILFGIVDYDCSPQTYKWYRGLASLLAHPDRPYAFKKPGRTISPKDLGFAGLSSMGGDITFELSVSYLNDEETLDVDIERRSNGVVDINPSIGLFIKNVKYSLYKHFKVMGSVIDETIRDPSDSFSSVDAAISLISVYQWQLCKLHKKPNGNIVANHVSSGLEFELDQSRTITDYSRFFEDNAHWIIFFNITEADDTYRINRFYHVFDLPAFLEKRGSSQAAFEGRLKFRFPPFGV